MDDEKRAHIKNQKKSQAMKHAWRKKGAALRRGARKRSRDAQKPLDVKKLVDSLKEILEEFIDGLDVEYIVNPTATEFRRFSKDYDNKLRTGMDLSGNLYIWPATQMLHPTFERWLDKYKNADMAYGSCLIVEDMKLNINNSDEMLRMFNAESEERVTEYSEEFFTAAERLSNLGVNTYEGVDAYTKAMHQTLEAVKG
jgi:hypothetical protein